MEFDLLLSRQMLERCGALGLPCVRHEEREAVPPSARMWYSHLESLLNPHVGQRERETRTMDPSTIIRKETTADIDAITEVTVAAFQTLEISNNTEQFIIMALRAAKGLTVSLVAELDGRVIGHLAFSPVTISDGTPNWYGLGPVSVLPAHHRQGIGTALIQEGLSRLKDLGAAGCCVVGHPDYYRKFGFENPPTLVLEGVPAEVFFALSFDDSNPEGTVAFHEAFKADVQQGAEGDAVNRAP